jgi:hypothetical protein
MAKQGRITLPSVPSWPKRPGAAAHVASAEAASSTPALTTRESPEEGGQRGRRSRSAPRSAAVKPVFRLQAFAGSPASPPPNQFPAAGRCSEAIASPRRRVLLPPGDGMPDTSRNRRAIVRQASLCHGGCSPCWVGRRTGHERRRPCGRFAFEARRKRGLQKQSFPFLGRNGQCPQSRLAYTPRSSGGEENLSMLSVGG